MAVFAYPVNVKPDSPGFMATFDDFDRAVTHGDTADEALAWAVDLLETMVSYRISEGLDLPRPSPAKGRPLAHLSPLSAAKAGLYMAMREAGVSRAELARRLGWHMPQVARLFDLRHRSRMDQIQQALATLGKRLIVEVHDAA